MAWTLSVTELNDYVRRAIAGDPTLRFIQLRGEISDCKSYASGHLYFVLKDEQSRIQCVLYRQYAQKLPFTPENGMKVLLTGSVGLYTASGTYQFYAESMKPDGIGELYLRYEALKAKLLKEGLFDVSVKKQLPLLPRKIGVVTSRSGAVIHDIATVTRRRFPGIQIILRSSLVQGEGAAQDIANGINELSALPDIDVIIVGRGGGSMEDLWAFNEEIVVRAIYACPIPVVSAVGHEVDVTLSDLAADVRAATPSAAAELCVPEKTALSETVLKLRQRLENAGKNLILQKKNNVILTQKRLDAQHPLVRLRDTRATAVRLTQQLKAAADQRLIREKARLDILSNKLSALGPRQAMNRGYAIAMGKGKVLTSVRDIPEEISVLFADGSVSAQVLQVREEDPFGEHRT